MPLHVPKPICLLALSAGLLSACAAPNPGLAQEPLAYAELLPSKTPTYADLVNFSLSSQAVAIVLVDDQITMPPERAPGVAPGFARLYVEATIQSLIAAKGPMGESVVFLVDVPLDARQRPIDIEEQAFIIFGASGTGVEGAFQLISSDSMLPATPEMERQVRRTLTQIAAPDSMSEIAALRDIISVPGNLAGESETQIFVELASGPPLSLSVIRRPGMRASWGVSLGEIVQQDAGPPAPDTIEWYRFACELPAELPESAFLQSDRESRNRARVDYALVLEELGPCERRLS